MKHVFSILVAFALVVGFAPLTCGALTAVPHSTACCCAMPAGPEPAPPHSAHCECSISSCDSLPVERTLAVSMEAPTGIDLPSAPITRLSAEAFLGETDFRIPHLAEAGPGILEYIQCVRLLL